MLEFIFFLPFSVFAMIVCLFVWITTAYLCVVCKFTWHYGAGNLNLFACCCFYCFYHDGLFVPVLFTWHGSEEELATAGYSSGLSLLHLQMSEAPGDKIMNRSPNIFAKKFVCA